MSKSFLECCDNEDWADALKLVEQKIEVRALVPIRPVPFHVSLLTSSGPAINLFCDLFNYLLPISMQAESNPLRKLELYLNKVRLLQKLGTLRLALKSADAALSIDPGNARCVHL